MSIPDVLFHGQIATAFSPLSKNLANVNSRSAKRPWLRRDPSSPCASSAPTQNEANRSHVVQELGRHEWYTAKSRTLATLFHLPSRGKRPPTTIRTKTAKSNHANSAVVHPQVSFAKHPSMAKRNTKTAAKQAPATLAKKPAKTAAQRIVSGSGGKSTVAKAATKSTASKGSKAMKKVAIRTTKKKTSSAVKKTAKKVPNKAATSALATKSKDPRKKAAMKLPVKSTKKTLNAAKKAVAPAKSAGKKKGTRLSAKAMSKSTKRSKKSGRVHDAVVNVLASAIGAVRTVREVVGEVLQGNTTEGAKEQKKGAKGSGTSMK